MDYSEGFTNILYDVIVVAGLVASMYFLSKAMNGGLPMGTAYAVWVGIGAVGTIAFSAIMGIETFTYTKAIFVAMIVIGIIGLQMTSGAEKSD